MLNTLIYCCFFFLPFGRASLHAFPILTNKIVADSTITQKIGIKDSNQNLITQPYIKSGDTISFVNTLNKTVYVYCFTKGFLPAPAPMDTRFFDNSPNMEVDSVYTIQNGASISFKKTGLYFAQTDTTGNIGLGFRVENGGYPKFRKVALLTKSTIYISTDNEIENVLAAKNQRQVFNNFWLNLGGNSTASQQLIREYFNRVMYANRYFTTYKEGWKTDKGMIYIVFGKPNDIQITERGELWSYIGTRKRTTFEFIKKKNIFSDQHFELVRHLSFQKIWYQQVEKWRTGRIE